MYLLYKLSVTGTGINTSGLNIPLSVRKPFDLLALGFSLCEYYANFEMSGLYIYLVVGKRVHLGGWSNITDAS